jgi:hypothetical protein
VVPAEEACWRKEDQTLPQGIDQASLGSSAFYPLNFLYHFF